MKKSIVFALAVAAAFGAKAAVVDWQYKITGQATDAVPGYTAYLVSQTDWNKLVADGINSGDDISNKALDTATFVKNGSSGKNASKTYNSSTQNATGTPDSRPVEVGTATSLNAYIVLFDYSQNAYLLSDPLTLVSRGENDSLGTSGIVSKTIGEVSGGSWQPVPEPTSVALLALGLAALGLKRKVA